MVKRWVLCGLTLILFTAGLSAQDRQTPLPNLVEALRSLPGLETVGTPVSYDSTTLDRLDPNLARAMRLYGARGAAVVDGQAGGGKARITVLQMTDSPAAYGIHTLQRTKLVGEPTPILIGAASFASQGRLFFWQSNYAVQIEGPKQIQVSIAQSLSKSILGRSQKPPVSAYLPAEHLVEGSEKYLLSPDTIDPAVGVDPDKLGFDSSAEAASASYDVGGKSAHLLLILYPTQHIAKRYADEMDAASKASAAFRKRAGPLVAIVYGSTSEVVATSILRDVSHELKVTWDEPPPGLGLGTMLITIFSFIAIALVFTTVAGVSFGGLRVFLKSRYPNRVFDRPETMELIQLKLVQGVTDRRIESNDRGGSV
jgi:hypothetical protein